MSIQMERKSFSYATTLLDQIHAYATDIGWMASMQLFEAKKPEAEKVIPWGTNADSACDLLKNTLDLAKRDTGLVAWFDAMDKRAGKELSDFNGSFRELLAKIEALKYNKAIESLQDQLELCLQATSICNALKGHLYDEMREVKNPIRELLNYVPD